MLLRPKYLFAAGWRRWGLDRNGQPYQATSSWAHTDVAAWLVVER